VTFDLRWGLTFKEDKLKTFGSMKTWVILPIGMFVFGWASIGDVQVLDREIDKLHSDLELGDKTNARNFLRRVIERFPHSEQSEMAKKKLGTIK